MRNIFASTIFIATFAAVLHATTWWVDSSASGDGSSIDSPAADFLNILSSAGAFDTINVRGGSGRAYSFVRDYQGCLIDKEGITIQGHGDEKPLFAITNDVRQVSNAVITVAAPHFTLRNIDFSVTSGGLDTSKAISCANSPFFTAESCRFYLDVSKDFGYTGGTFLYTDKTSTNIVFRNCELLNFGARDPYRAYIVLNVTDKSEITGNVFSNTTRLLTGRGSVLFASNIVINPRMPVLGGNYTGIVTSGYDGIGTITACYNIFTISPGTSGEVFRKSREGFNRGTNLFYNNTVYGYKCFLYCDSLNYFNSRWTASVFNNLVINSETNIIEFGDIRDDRPTAFNPGTRISNNIRAGGISELFGSQTTVSNASVAAGCTVENNYLLDEVRFRNTVDINDPDFFRPDSNKNPELLNGYGRFGGAFPKYIGAVEPFKQLTLLILR